MRLPTLPIFVDEFPALQSRQWQGSGPVIGDVFLLSHFHTDHMKGLHSAWAAGIILTSTITAQLLLSRFEGLRGRVLALPFWCRTPVMSATAAAGGGATSHSSAADCNTELDSHTVYVTLLPAFHIPGSAMIFIETPAGVTYLHTGDFKYTEAARLSPLRSFLQTHRVDHLYLDDTWLHLGQAAVTQWPPGESGQGGVAVLSKLLNKEQVEEAMEAIRRRMEHQRKLFEQRHGENGTGDETPSTDAAMAPQPFVVRVYLHNQFGKELLIQQLADCLRTRALLDDMRHARLLTVVEALEEERDDLKDFEAATAATNERPPQQKGVAAPSTPLSKEEQAWRAAGGEAAHYPYHRNTFLSASQAAALRSPREMPLVEVVSSRSAIAPAALQAASESRNGTPHYGVVISGWARLQREQAAGPLSSYGGQVWHIPTTLHSTPQEIIDFVALLRPLSVTPLHYRPSRGAVVMQRLGPFLRTPFVNHHDTGLPDSDCARGAMEGGGLASPYWVLCLPRHILSTGGLPAPGGDASRARCCSSGGDCDGGGLDALVARPRLGYRVRRPPVVDGDDPLTAAEGVEAPPRLHGGDTSADAGQQHPQCLQVGRSTQLEQRGGKKRLRPNASEACVAALVHRRALSLSEIADAVV